MEKITGIGGFFFRSKEPKKLGQWYEENFGINQVPKSYNQQPWQQNQGITVFAPFPENSEYFEDDLKNWMINFRVTNLAKMVKQLEEAGIEVEVDKNEYPNGKFARLKDPEGNPIQLWEPK